MNPKSRHVARAIEALRRSNAMAGSESVLYVALGDSVTAGWLEHGVLDSDAAYPSLFRRRLAGLFPRAMLSVLNAGLGGENVEGALARLERDCLRHDPNLVTPNTRGDSLHEQGIVDTYIRAVRAVARAEDIGLADVYAVYQGWIRAGAHPPDLLSNRVSHPTREGHAIFANALIEFFQP